MPSHPIRFGLATVAVVGLSAPFLMVGQASAGAVRTKGVNKNVDMSWIEYDPDDLLGLPGNVHVGYLYAYTGQWGNYVGGSVSDFDCDEGETPWGGHDVSEGIVDDASETATAAVGDAIDGIVESGGVVIDADVVSTEVEAQLADDVTDQIQDEFEEFPVCDYIQDRYLDGSETATVSVNLRTKTATITGTLIVHGGHGEHGEPGTVLGQPTVDLKISGGDWNKWTSSYSSRGADYRYSMSENGTSYSGGTVEGRIGAMGFADDADDEAYGSFGRSKFVSVERVR